MRWISSFALAATTTALIALITSPHSASAAPKRELFEASQLDDITIDGRADDWDKTQTLTIQLTPPLESEPLEPGDLTAEVKIGWDETGMLFLATITDDTQRTPR